MKKLFILLAVAVGLAACGTTNSPTENSLTIDLTKLQVDSTGGEYVVMVSSTSAWSATSNKSWISITPNSGQGDAFVTVAVTQGAADTAKVLFSNGENTATLTIIRGNSGGGGGEDPEPGPDPEPDPEPEPTINGALPGKFSISSTKKVQFSKGNLTCMPKYNTWRFVDEQYEFVGANNENISSDYVGYIDLFSWGTGASPASSPSGTFTDWGINPISNGGNQANLWRTLTHEEWDYLFNERADAVKKRAPATVKNYSVESIAGYMLLPDEWTIPAGLNFIYSATRSGTNTYSYEDWIKMEKAGAVFLPCAGYRSGTKVYGVKAVGEYWLADLYSEKQAWIFCINYYEAHAHTESFYEHINYGISVRLVHDVK